MLSWETILWNNFEFGQWVQEEKLFKDISYLELWQPFCSAERNRLHNFGSWYHEEHFWEIILNLDLWFLFGRAEPFVQFWLKASWGTNLWNNFWIWTSGYFEFGPVVQEEMSFKAISYLELCLLFCSAEPNHLCNFGRGHYEEQFCEIILNLGQVFRRCRFKDFLSGALAALLFSGVEPFMQFWKGVLWGTFMWSNMK